MLTMRKNNLATNVVKNEVEIRQLEVDWYCENYNTINGQAALLAGFAFNQVTYTMPEDAQLSFLLEFAYLFLTSVTIGLELSAIVLSTYLSVWAPSLGLRGHKGSADLHKAVDCLRDYQLFVFFFFVMGWVTFFISNILQVWVFFAWWVAFVATFPLTGFVAAIIWYVWSISSKLRLREEEVVIGKINQIRPYENIGDIDQGLNSGSTPEVRAGRTSRERSERSERYLPRAHPVGDTAARAPRGSREMEGASEEDDTDDFPLPPSRSSLPSRSSQSTAPHASAWALLAGAVSR